MIVTCPNCTTRLQLDGAKVPARPFSVRCPKCQQIVNAQPPAPGEQRRDALAAVGDVPTSAKPQAETAAPTAAPLLGDVQPSAEAPDDVLRLLSSLLRREAAGDGGVRGASPPAGGRSSWERRRALVCAGSAFG